MKRFYKDVSVGDADTGHALLLDGRAVKTPLRNPLLLPNANIADAIAEEWRAQGEDIDPATMPLTALAQGALDQVRGERPRIAARIAGFADSDMLYYRADETQAALAEHQAASWGPLLDWAQSRYDVSFNLASGIIHTPQPDETIACLTAVVEAQDDWTLAAMLSLVGLTGSLVIVLALVEQELAADALWPLANLEELWQEQQWGADDVAVAKRKRNRGDYDAAVRFLRLSSS